MLKKILKEGECFKLICGAGNENLEEIERLVALYAKAGCHFFDLSASKKVLKAAQNGLDYAVTKELQKDYHFCISIGTKNDPHINKVKINSDKCKRCKECIEICPQKAINVYLEVKEGCVGCLKCKSVCKNDAIEVYQKKQLPSSDILNLASCIELHASDTNEEEINDIWSYLNKNFQGMLSICIDRSKLSNEKLIKRIKRLIKDREPYTTIIQADGLPISGGNDNYKSTLQAVAMAEIIQNEELPVYLLISGGTNSKTIKLARLCEINFNGIGVGSYARKIVKKYIERSDFLKNNTIFDKAVEKAQSLIISTQTA